MRQSHLVLKVSKLSKLNNELKNGFFRRPRRRRHRHLSVCFASSVYLLFPTRPVPRSVSQSAAVGDGDGGLLFLPSFLPCQTFAKAGQIGRAGEREGEGAGGRTTRLYPRASGLQFHSAISLTLPSLLVTRQPGYMVPLFCRREFR